MRSDQRSNIFHTRISLKVSIIIRHSDATSWSWAICWQGRI